MAKSNSFEQNYYIKWKIMNGHSGSVLKSEEFRYGEANWRLQLLATATGDCDADFQIFINQVNLDECHGVFYVRTFIENQMSRTSKLVRVSKRSTKRCIWWQNPVKRSWWQNPFRKSSTDKNWTFYVMFESVKGRSIGKKLEHKSIQTAADMDPVHSLGSLYTDLGGLLARGVQSDVLLKCGNRSIPAHRFILSARSEVFSAMFSNGTLECSSGYVNIPKEDQPALDMLLRYIYCGEIPEMTMDVALCLYAAADKYALHALTAQCRAFMVENLNKDSAFSILISADIHSDKDLKETVISFLVNNEELLQRDKWFQYSYDYPKLAVEVYHAVHKK